MTEKGKLWRQVRVAAATSCKTAECISPPVIPKWSEWIDKSTIIFRYRCKTCKQFWTRTIEDPWSLSRTVT